MDSYKIICLPAAQQDEGHHSFQGGSPLMPPEIEAPRCRLCGTGLSFYFQVQFPAKTAWAGRTMGFFSCTACQSLEHIVPTVPVGYSPKGYDIPDRYIAEQQSNFRVVVFDSDQPSVVRGDIAPKFEFEPFGFQKLRGDNRSPESKIGGRPYWRSDTEVPRSYMGSRLTFLMQVESDWKFRVRRGAGDAPGVGGIPSDAEGALFWGLPTYFSGTTDLDPPQVWTIVQRG